MVSTLLYWRGHNVMPSGAALKSHRYSGLNGSNKTKYNENIVNSERNITPAREFPLTPLLGIHLLVRWSGAHGRYYK